MHMLDRLQQQDLVLDHVSPATRLLEKRRQMFEVQEALEAQKAEFSRKVGALPEQMAGRLCDCFCGAAAWPTHCSLSLC